MFWIFFKAGLTVWARHDSSPAWDGSGPAIFFWFKWFWVRLSNRVWTGVKPASNNTHPGRPLCLKLASSSGVGSEMYSMLEIVASVGDLESGSRFWFSCINYWFDWCKSTVQLSVQTHILGSFASPPTGRRLSSTVYAISPPRATTNRSPTDLKFTQAWSWLGLAHFWIPKSSSPLRLFNTVGPKQNDSPSHCLYGVHQLLRRTLTPYTPYPPKLKLIIPTLFISPFYCCTL